MEFENILQFPGILQNWVNEANMSQLAQEKQVNLGTSARLNALSQYVLVRNIDKLNKYFALSIVSIYICVYLHTISYNSLLILYASTFK